MGGGEDEDLWCVLLYKTSQKSVSIQNLCANDFMGIFYLGCSFLQVFYWRKGRFLRLILRGLKKSFQSHYYWRVLFWYTCQVHLGFHAHFAMTVSNFFLSYWKWLTVSEVAGTASDRLGGGVKGRLYPPSPLTPLASLTHWVFISF